MHEEHRDDHVAFLRKFHNATVKIVCQVTLGQRQQTDVIKQQITAWIDALAELFDLFFGIAGQKILAIDAFLYKLRNERIEGTVWFFRVGFVSTVGGRFYIKRSETNAQLQTSIRLLFGDKLKGGHREGVADFFAGNLLTAQFGIDAAKQALFIEHVQSFQSPIGIDGEANFIKGELTVVRFNYELGHE